jgi:hypothetical protein
VLTGIHAPEFTGTLERLFGNRDAFVFVGHKCNFGDRVRGDHYSPSRGEVSRLRRPWSIPMHEPFLVCSYGVAQIGLFHRLAPDGRG